jgi:hypothetical protein
VLVASALAIAVVGAADAAAGGDAGTEPGAAADASAPALDAAATGDDSTLPPDSEGVGFVQDDGAIPSFNTPDIFQFLCITNPHVVSFSFRDVKAPFSDVAGCKTQFVMSGYPPNETACSCENCFSLVQQCAALPACRAMEDCILKSGCSGSSCYYNNGPCASVYDNYGSGGLASNLTSLISNCFVKAGCKTGS